MIVRKSGIAYHGTNKRPNVTNRENSARPVILAVLRKVVVFKFVQSVAISIHENGTANWNEA